LKTTGLGNQQAPSRSPGSFCIEVGKGTLRGKARAENEDALLTLEASLEGRGQVGLLGLFMVADGLGGEARGGEASVLAVGLVAERLLREIGLSIMSNAVTPPRPVREMLEGALLAAHHALRERLPGSATSLTLALVLRESIHLAHVGDTRAYLFDRRGWKRITEDHSLLARLIKVGKAPPDEERSSQQRLLYQALGQLEEPQVDFHFLPLPSEGSLLLCTDGLWNAVSEEDMWKAVNEAPSPQEACERLLQKASTQGAEDDASIIIVTIRAC